MAARLLKLRRGHNARVLYPGTGAVVEGWASQRSGEAAHMVLLDLQAARLTARAGRRGRAAPSDVYSTKQ